MPINTGTKLNWCGSTRWRSEPERLSYTTKLLEALRRTRSGPTPTRIVRAAADRALAVSARGQSRWSRAMLLSASHPHKLMPRRRRRVVIGSRRFGSDKEVERREKMLGRLVPGCRKLPLPKLLEEATDYVAALEMQVRAMSMLAELLAVLPDRNGSL